MSDLHLAKQVKAASLLKLADHIMEVDGDRDHMNKSNLTCADTQSIARILRRLAADMKAETRTAGIDLEDKT